MGWLLPSDKVCMPAVRIEVRVDSEELCLAIAWEVHSHKQVLTKVAEDTRAVCRAIANGERRRWDLVPRMILSSPELKKLQNSLATLSSNKFGTGPIKQTVTSCSILFEDDVPGPTDAQAEAGAAAPDGEEHQSAPGTVTHYYKFILDDRERKGIAEILSRLAVIDDTKNPLLEFTVKSKLKHLQVCLPVACIDFEDKEIYVFEKVAGEPWSEESAWANLRDFVVSSHESIEDLHKAGFAHCDVRLPNMIKTAANKTILIDIDRMHDVSEDVDCFKDAMMYPNVASGEIDWRQHAISVASVLMFGAEGSTYWERPHPSRMLEEDFKERLDAACANLSCPAVGRAVYELFSEMETERSTQLVSAVGELKK